MQPWTCGFLDRLPDLVPWQTHFPALCKVALEDQADVVVGSRRSGAAAQMPMVRRLGDFLWSNMVTLVGSRRVIDPASGMRVLRRSMLPQLHPLPDGLNFTPVMSTWATCEELRVIEVPISYCEPVGRSRLSVVRDGSRLLTTILWAAMEYNPVRVLGVIGLAALRISATIGLSLVVLRLQGVRQLGHLGTLGVFSVFSALVLAVAGISILTLGTTFNYLVSLHHNRANRKGLFGRPIFDPSIDHHFVWVGLVSIMSGALLGAVSLSPGDSGCEISRVWLRLLASALLVLTGAQLVVSWILMRVLDGLSERNVRVMEDLGKPAGEEWLV